MWLDVYTLAPLPYYETAEVTDLDDGHPRPVPQFRGPATVEEALDNASKDNDVPPEEARRRFLGVFNALAEGDDCPPVPA